MNSNGYVRVREYVDNLINDEETKLLIFDFSILWNVYENDLYATEHSISKISRVLGNIKLSEDNKWEIDNLYYQLIRFLNFKDCLLSNNEINYEEFKHYFNFRIKKKDIDGNVVGAGEISEIQLRKVINSKNSVGKLYLLLIVVSRVRNNMFHGLKDVSELKYNKELFLLCNKVLFLILDIKNS